MLFEDIHVFDRIYYGDPYDMMYSGVVVGKANGIADLHLDLGITTKDINISDNIHSVFVAVDTEQRGQNYGSKPGSACDEKKCDSNFSDALGRELQENLEALITKIVGTFEGTIINRRMQLRIRHIDPRHIQRAESTTIEELVVNDNAVIRFFGQYRYAMEKLCDLKVKAHTQDIEELELKSCLEHLDEDRKSLIVEMTRGLCALERITRIEKMQKLLL